MENPLLEQGSPGQVVVLAQHRTLTTTAGSYQLKFDYAALDPVIAEAAKATVNRIRQRLHKAQIETGRDLIAIKDDLGHGHFIPWLKAEFQMTPRSAENFMSAARFVAGKSEKFSHLPPSAVFLLAAPSASKAVVDDVVAKVEAGQSIRVQDIKRRLVEAADKERTAEAEARRAPEEVKRARDDEKRRRGAEEKRQRKLKEECETNEAKRQKKALEVARFLVGNLGGEKVTEFFKLMHGTDWYRVDGLVCPYRLGLTNMPSVPELEMRFGGEVAQ